MLGESEPLEPRERATQWRARSFARPNSKLCAQRGGLERQTVGLIRYSVREMTKCHERRRANEREPESFDVFGVGRVPGAVEQPRLDRESHAPSRRRSGRSGDRWSDPGPCAPYDSDVPTTGVAQRIDAILARRAQDAPPMESAILRGVVWFRWAALVWLAVVLVIGRSRVERWWLAVVLVALAAGITVFATWAIRRSPGTLLSWPFVVAENGVIFLLAVAGGWVFDAGAVSNTTALASQWALAGILNTGVAFGLAGGLASASALSVERVIGTIINVQGWPSPGEWLSALSSAVTFLLAGALVGGVVELLRRAERRVAIAEAREEVARTLHDGVLQTLAVIERRADDEMLAEMAREQERELREFLFGTGTTSERGGAADIGPRLRDHAARYEQRFEGRVDVVLAPDLPHLDDETAAALVGAVGEAVTNAGKHGGAARVTVYVEPADPDGIAVSVRDDGSGFDPEQMSEGVGVSRSIKGRVAERGGTVEIESRPGEGTEVRMWLP